MRVWRFDDAYADMGSTYLLLSSHRYRHGGSYGTRYRGSYGGRLGRSSYGGYGK